MFSCCQKSPPLGIKEKKVDLIQTKQYLHDLSCYMNRKSYSTLKMLNRIIHFANDTLERVSNTRRDEQKTKVFFSWFQRKKKDRNHSTTILNARIDHRRNGHPFFSAYTGTKKMKNLLILSNKYTNLGNTYAFQKLEKISRINARQSDFLYVYDGSWNIRSRK